MEKLCFEAIVVEITWKIICIREGHIVKKTFCLNITQKLIAYILIASFIPLLILHFGARSQARILVKDEMNRLTHDLLSEKKNNIRYTLAIS